MRHKKIALLVIATALVAAVGCAPAIAATNGEAKASDSSDRPTIEAQDSKAKEDSAGKTDNVAVASGSAVTKNKAAKETSESKKTTETKSSSKAQDSSAGKAASRPAVDEPWSEEADCASCHVNEAELAKDCLMEKHEAIACSSCHTDEDGALTKAHEKYDNPKTRLPKKLRKTEVASNACESCHDMAKITEASANCTALTDDNGTTVNPHEIMVRETHVEKSGADLTCGSCHKMHTADSLDTETVAAETASERCLGCHHQNVYECGTCHE